MSEKMTIEKASELLGKGYHCSSCVLWHTAEKLGIDKNLALKFSGGLGGGCFHGGTCGAITGGVISIGLVHGYDEESENIPEQNAKLVEKVHELENRFIAINGSIECKELLNDMSFAVPEQAEIIKTQGLTKNCPKFCVDVCEILDEILDELK